MSDTVMRYIAMLKSIPHHGSGITALGLHAKLIDLGYTVDKRSVERDLVTLCGAFPITNDEARPARWHWAQNAPFTTLPSMDPVTALTLELVARFLTPLMPPRLMQPLAPQLKAARNVLDDLKTSSVGRWANRIAVVPPGQALLPPTVTADVTEAVYEALLTGQRFEVTYRAAEADRPKRYPISPLGLVLRGAVIYLVGTAKDYDEPRVYALHRMSRPKPLAEQAVIPNGFDLNRYVREERAFDFPADGKIKLELRVSPFLANHLSESRLSLDQVISPIPVSNQLIVSATVENTEQLLWWLLGFGVNVEVLKPVSIRHSVSAKIAELARVYL